MQARLSLLRALAALWGLTEEQVQQYNLLRKPTMQISRADISIGRARLPVLASQDKQPGLLVAANANKVYSHCLPTDWKGARDCARPDGQFVRALSVSLHLSWCTKYAYCGSALVCLQHCHVGQMAPWRLSAAASIARLHVKTSLDMHSQLLCLCQRFYADHTIQDYFLSSFRQWLPGRCLSIV